MLLIPKKTKYNKNFRNKIKDKLLNRGKISFGNIAIKSLESGNINSSQIEAARNVIKKKVKRTCKLWVRIFSNNPITAKSKHSRMGKGKGVVKYWVSKVKEGQILYELEGKSLKNMISAFKFASKKLCLKTKIVIKK
jgi:large subunit ribosomal protein L16